jgi:hypothetical protein
MRKRVVGSCLFGASLFLVGVRAASAQGPATFSASYDVVYHELEETSAVGVHADVAKPFGMISGVGEVGANHFDGATVISLAGGGRYPLHSSNARMSPAVQILLGLWHCNACEISDAFVQPGFLLDFAKSASLKIRGQFDVRRIFFDFGAEWAERLSVGLVWELK